MNIWMVIEIVNREVVRKIAVHGHSEAVRQANEWMKNAYANAAIVNGHEYANTDTNCAWITYGNGKAYDVYVVEVA